SNARSSNARSRNCRRPESGLPNLRYARLRRASSQHRTPEACVPIRLIMPTEFRNEPLTDFTKPENAQAMCAAIEKIKTQLGKEYPLVIGGERITTDSKIDSINPSNRTQIVGRFNKAT